MNRRHQRRNYFIKKNLQGRLILGYFLFVTGGCLLFTFLLAAFSADTLTVVYRNHDLQLGLTPMMLAKKILAAQWIFIVLGGGIIVAASLFITHHLAGPVFRLEQALDNMLKGNLNDFISLRKKDEGKELAAKINQLNRQLSRQIRSIDVHARHIEQLAGPYLDTAEKQPAEASGIPAHVLDEILTHTKAIRETTHSFVLADE